MEKLEGVFVIGMILFTGLVLFSGPAAYNIGFVIIWLLLLVSAIMIWLA